MEESHRDGVQLILPDSSCLNDKINRMLKPDKSLTGNLHFTLLSFRKCGSFNVVIVLFLRKPTTHNSRILSVKEACNLWFHSSPYNPIHWFS
jgi:hypothetical protein